MIKARLSRVLLMVVGLLLIGAAMLPSQSAPAGAAPLMLVTDTTTAEPPTRTPTTPNTPTSTNTTIATETPTATETSAATETPTATATTTVIETATPSPTSPPDPPSDPTHTPTPPADPSATPEITPTPVLVADPAIVKTVNRNIVAVGDIVEFTLTVTNLGNMLATSVVVEDSLPSFLALEGVSTTRGEVSTSGSTVRVVIGDLAPGETVVIRITARVIAPAVAPNNTNVGTVSSGDSGDDPGNNTSQVTLTTEPPPPPATVAPPARLPVTGGASGLPQLLLAGLGMGLIALSLLIRRR